MQNFKVSVNVLDMSFRREDILIVTSWSLNITLAQISKASLVEEHAMFFVVILTGLCFTSDLNRTSDFLVSKSERRTTIN